MPKAQSRAQARFFSAVIGGRAKSSMTKAEAKRRMRGVKYKSLPARKKGRRRK